ncbi:MULTISPECIES: hypothetical protein [Kribbella]|uniref:hypothetical protein n=1 Tax=Kribbella TaxID=182639 RepID=UPI00104F3C54|nr:MULTISPECIES: hypothetical protein [Kribbella]
MTIISPTPRCPGPQYVDCRTSVSIVAGGYEVVDRSGLREPRLRRIRTLIPQLGRSCQLHDLVANSLGAIAGVGPAATVQLVLRPVSGPRTLTSPVYVVEHNAVLAVRRPSVRHRRAELALAMAKSSGRLRPVARAR